MVINRLLTEPGEDVDADGDGVGTRLVSLYCMSLQVPPVVLGSGNNILINPIQRGNLVLDCIRDVGKEFGDILADYQVGKTAGVLFLSLKYHRLHPEYIHIRIEKLGNSYTLRILLVLCDITEHRDAIRELTKVCLINNMTVLVAFSFEEAGHYLSTLKQFEHKPPDMIKERVDKDYNTILRNVLTSISKVNKTDVETLRTFFGSFANVARATPEQLHNLPGFGQVKVKNMKAALDKPLRHNATRTTPSTAGSFKGNLEPTLQSSESHQPTLPEVSVETNENVIRNLSVRKQPPSAMGNIELDLTTDDD